MHIGIGRHPSNSRVEIRVEGFLLEHGDCTLVRGALLVVVVLAASLVQAPPSQDGRILVEVSESLLVSDVQFQKEGAQRDGPPPHVCEKNPGNPNCEPACGDQACPVDCATEPEALACLDPGTDCPSRDFALHPWHWAQPYAATAAMFPEALAAGAQVWADATSAPIFGGITFGQEHIAGEQDFHSQIDFAFLDDPNVIATTTTWYWLDTGEAVESDAIYNMHHVWSPLANDLTMDITNIAAHETGHTLGLDHAAGECLTMYAFSGAGDDQKRSLGDGDLLGLWALYGR